MHGSFFIPRNCSPLEEIKIRSLFSTYPFTKQNYFNFKKQNDFLQLVAGELQLWHCELLGLLDANPPPKNNIVLTHKFVIMVSVCINRFGGFAWENDGSRRTLTEDRLFSSAITIRRQITSEAHNTTMSLAVENSKATPPKAPTHGAPTGTNQ